MAKIKLALVGANGRMGKEICKLVAQNNRLEATLAVLRNGEASPFKNHLKSLESFEKSKKLDVVIDFSTREQLQKTISYCIKNKTPLVTGVTGLSPNEIKRLEAAGKKIAIFYSANMSLGLASLRAALSALASLQGFDFQIIEGHHIRKKDKPSGTAILLQKELERVTKRKCPEPLSYRAGGIIGQHEVIAASSGEVLRLSHEALDRGIFAQGTLRAVEFIVKACPGLYDMKDLVGEKIEKH